MRTLIAEDDHTSQVLLQEILKPYGAPTVAGTGKEALEAVRRALDAGQPYDLICLDIMMPELNGQDALRAIRSLEKEKGIAADKRAKIVMTTALKDPKNIIAAHQSLCDAYLVKPIDKAKLLENLETLKLI
jgi:two-component system chemotaxis response regulator CheY